MTATLIWEEKGLLRIFSEQLCGDALFESNLKLQSDRRFKAIDYIINDFSAVTSHSVDTTHLGLYSQTDKIISATKHKLKIALIVPEGPLSALAVGYRSLMQDQLFECKIFPTLEDARCWCD